MLDRQVPNKDASARVKWINSSIGSRWLDGSRFHG